MPVSTRLIRSHETWEPWKYQQRAVTHLMEHRSAALFMDPGLGKTAIAFEAFRRLKAAGIVSRMLVVAPLRVCQLVWRQEGQKWTQFRDLTISLMHGPKKDKRLNDEADIHLINPEGIQWLSQQFYGRSDLPWDVVCIDELPAFKNHRAIRSKRLRAKLGGVGFRWGLTGSPAPNGYMDLFGQMLMLDDGVALGRYITHFRDRYFTRGYDGFSWDLRPDSAERIEAKIAPYVLRMASADYLELPPLVTNKIAVGLPDGARKKYEEMKKEMILALPEGIVTAANSAAVYSKLKQLTNGAVYLNSDHDFAEIHDAKLVALEELIAELAGMPLLVAYEFQSDLTRIRVHLGKDTPTLTGQSEKQITALEAEWNRGNLPVLLVHPASAGHGLNLQGAGASHICWVSRPWDLSLYDQTIRRIYRQGSTAERVINHVLHIPGTMDDIVDTALRDKDVTQQRLLNALNAEVIREGASLRGGSEMALKKLGYQGADQGSETANVPRGWGTAPAAAATAEPEKEEAQEAPRPRSWGAAPADPQREAIANKLSAPAADEDDETPPPAQRALAAFPPGVVQQLTGEDADEEDEEESGDSDGAAWEGVSTRTRNVLEQAGYASPTAAFEAGQEALVGLQGFGAKSWQELQEAAKSALQAPAEAAPKADPAQNDLLPAPKAVRAADAHTVPQKPSEMRGAARPGLSWDTVRIEMSGLPPSAIAAALAAIAHSIIRA